VASIIFICTGNMCRSPMAEGLLRTRLSELDRPDILVSSMGTHAQTEQKATDYAITVCSEKNIDITRHLSRHLDPLELKESDLIFVMEPVHKDFLNTFFPQVSDRTFFLGSWPGPDNKKGIIKDPVGSSLENYRKTFRILSDHIERITPFILLRFSKGNIKN